MTATPRSGEGHDVAPDGSGRPDCMDLHENGQATTVLYRPHTLSRRGRKTTVVLSALLIYVIIDICLTGPLTHLDKAYYKWHPKETIPGLHSWAWGYDKFGQRSVLLPILLVVAGVLARRHHTWRPLVLAFTSFAILNIIVGAMKLIIGRSETRTGDPSVFNGGVIFPSGHSSNMVLTGGGVLVGGLLLQAVIVFDRKTAHVRDDPPAILGPALRLGLFEANANRINAIPIARGSLGGVVEEVPEVRPAPPAADLRSTHAE
jgi:hypothetical protein